MTNSILHNSLTILHNGNYSAVKATVLILHKYAIRIHFKNAVAKCLLVISSLSVIIGKIQFSILSNFFSITVNAAGSSILHKTKKSAINKKPHLVDGAHILRQYEWSKLVTCQILFPLGNDDVKINPFFDSSIYKMYKNYTNTDKHVYEKGLFYTCFDNMYRYFKNNIISTK